MAVELKFTSNIKSKLVTNLIVYASFTGDIIIKIHDESLDEHFCNSYVSLDRETAIKLAKELRKQISMLEA